MALSEHEQRLLDEMERSFYQSEADVVSTSPGAPRRINYRSLLLGVVAAVIGVGLLVGGVAAQQLWLGLIGFAIMLGGVLLAFSRPSGDDVTAAPTESKAPSSESAKESLSERFERRWDQRMGGER
ncbi:MAG: DUF3040 domain-containing protein [Leucobacter sp.]